MKRNFIATLLCLLLIPAAVAVADMNNELTGSGSYTRHPHGGGSFWSLSGEALLGPGRFLVGPAVSMTEGTGKLNDRLTAGLVSEINFAGHGKGGPFVGARVLYDFDADKGKPEARYQIAARAGFKFARYGYKRLFKLYAEKVVKGYDDTGDLNVFAAIGARF